MCHQRDLYMHEHVFYSQGEWRYSRATLTVVDATFFHDREEYSRRGRRRADFLHRVDFCSRDPMIIIGEAGLDRPKVRINKVTAFPSGRRWVNGASTKIAQLTVFNFYGSLGKAGAGLASAERDLSRTARYPSIWDHKRNQPQELDLEISPPRSWTGVCCIVATSRIGAKYPPKDGKERLDHYIDYTLMQI